MFLIPRFILFCIPRILGVFIVIGIIDFILVGQDWDRLIRELPENGVVALGAGLAFAILDWWQMTRKAKET